MCGSLVRIVRYKMQKYEKEPCLFCSTAAAAVRIIALNKQESIDWAKFLTATTMSNYSVPPPSYGTTDGRRNGHDSQEPLLVQGSRDGFGGFYDQPAPGELPDDFKVRTSCRYISWSDYRQSMVSVSPKAHRRFEVLLFVRFIQFSVSMVPLYLSDSDV